jgi:hypothetical protein
MAEEEKKVSTAKRISDKERFRYIGFDVFPGRIKNLFKSDVEKDKLVDRVRQKRTNRDLGALRDDCTLLEARVSLSDRVVLTVACLFMVAALFFPWYSAYNEIVEEPAEEAAVVADSGAVEDSLLTDSVAVAALEGETEAIVDATTEAESDLAAEQEVVEDDYVEAPKEEIIHGYVAKKKIHKEYSRLTGLGSFASLGSAGSHVFSSGFVLILTGLLFLVLTLSCLALPAYTLYGLYGIKGNSDQKALKLKSILKLNWLPLLLFVAALIISFVGADYGPGTSSLYTSLGDSYGVAVFLGSLSWGVFITLAASIMLAAKGIEI